MRATEIVADLQIRLAAAESKVRELEAELRHALAERDSERNITAMMNDELGTQKARAEKAETDAKHFLDAYGKAEERVQALAAKFTKAEARLAELERKNTSLRTHVGMFAMYIREHMSDEGKTGMSAKEILRIIESEAPQQVIDEFDAIISEARERKE